MTRLASLTVSCIIVALAVLPSGLAGPACAKKNYSQQLCIERCKAKWGYPGSLMGGDRWGSVMRKTADTSNEAMDAVLAKACGVESSTANAHGAIATASEESSTTSSSYITSSSSTSTVESSTTTSTSTFSSSSTSSSTSSSASSSSNTVASTNNLLDGLSVTSTSTSETPTTTSTSTKETPTSTSTTEVFTSTSEPPPPPPPTTTSSTPEATPTRDSGDNNNNNDKNNQDQNQGSGNTGNTGNSGSTSGGDIGEYLDAHNSIRAQHGASDLTWSDEAAAKAQQWANKCVFEHSGGVLGAFGENLAAGTGSSYGIRQAVKGWTDEVKDYNSGSPQASHFTQVVWKATKQVGCAVASCDGIFDAKFGKAQYYVCEYFPQGNVIGQFGVNVQA